MVLLFCASFAFTACGGAGSAENRSNSAAMISPTVAVQTSEQNQQNANQSGSNHSTPLSPNTQAEILEETQVKSANSPIGNFDFRNYVYKLPRGWQDADGEDAILENGERRMAEKRIGLSYVATKYGDANGDGADDAFVILKIVTAGSAIPQIVYVFGWKDEKPEMLWHFRTGDRADGGLKNVYSDSGELVVELFGKDRYILGEVETMEIDGDEEQLCCPTHFTRTRYKWNGNNFLMRGKRLTFSIADSSTSPVENEGEIPPPTAEKQKGGKK